MLFEYDTERPSFAIYALEPIKGHQMAKVTHKPVLGYLIAATCAWLFVYNHVCG